jgi:hypothetical protein
MHTEPILQRFGLDEHDISMIQSREIDWELFDNQLVLLHPEHGQRTIGVLADEEVEELLNAYKFDRRNSDKPRSNSQLFSDGSIDNWAGVSLNTNWKPLTENYSTAAKVLGDNLKNDSIEPYLFLCRHTLELKLKAIIMLGQDFLNLSEDLPSHHDLAKLWTIAYPMILALKIKIDEEELKQIKAVVDEFHKSDPSSFSFRYPVTTKNKKITHDSKLLSFDLQNFREQFTQVDHFLSQVINQINHKIAWREIWKISNQQVDPIVTTPADKVKAQSTQGHP